MPTDLVVQERHGAVLELRLNNPPFNGLTGPLLMAYLAALEEARVDDGVRVVVTTANGPTWCAGGDLTQLDESATGFDLSDMLHQSTGESASLGLVDRQADLLGAGRHVLAIDAFDKPMIAAIDGAAAGGGLGLALLHDLRFASERALFTVAFTRVGLSLEMGLSYLLPRAVGPQAAFDLAATSRRVPAAEAQTLGLVWRVLPADEMMAAALAYAQDLAERPPLGLQITTRLLRRSWDHTLRRQLEIEWPSQVAAFRSPEARAAIARFLGSTGDADPLPGTARVE
ncbi:MAG TPA: enoyl-CoA hydratase-related protein [Acidimicrobiales bacterium]